MIVSRRRLLVAGALGLAAPALASTSGPALTRAAAEGSLALPVTADHGISRVQVFDFNLADKSVYQGRVAYTWGAKFRENQPPETIPSYYLFAQWADLRKVEYGNDRFTEAWFRENHPDWIIYKADQSTIAYYGSNPDYVPWDTTNPEAREWYYTNYIAPAIADGWTSVSLDMQMAYNMNGRAGHFAADGTWVARYTGEYSDQQYVEDIVDYTAYLVERLHADGVSVAANIYMPEQPSEIVLEGSARLASLVDVNIEEGGVVNNRNGWLPDAQNGMGDELWRQRFDYYRETLAQGTALAVIEFGSVGALASWPEGEVDYAIATYFLYKEPGAMLWLGTDYGTFPDRPEMNTDIGVATGPARELENGVWQRDYSDGLVLVNPSASTTLEVTLPDGPFADTRGAIIEGTASLAPTTGLTLRRIDESTVGFTVSVPETAKSGQSVNLKVDADRRRGATRAVVSSSGTTLAAGPINNGGKANLRLGRLADGPNPLDIQVQFSDGTATALRRTITVG